MKPSFFLRHRRFILASMTLIALSASSLTTLFFSPQAQAQYSNQLNNPYDGATDPDTKLPFVVLPDGLKYVDIKVGTGPIPKGGDTVSVNYVGKLTDGTVFDASAKHGGLFTYQHQITGLIKGWTEGVSSMKQGGKRKLIIPSELGYGSQGQGDVIPPNATLVFEIELVEVKPLSTP